MTQLEPVDEMLAEHGVCWACHQGFEADEFYVLIDAWVTCLGCVAQLTCPAD